MALEDILKREDVPEDVKAEIKKNIAKQKKLKKKSIEIKNQIGLQSDKHKKQVTEEKPVDTSKDSRNGFLDPKEMYHLVVEKASDGVWLLDKEFLTLYVNPAMEEMLGYTQEEMLGRSWYDFGDPAWVTRAKELEKRRESGVKEPHEFLFIHKDGREVMARIATTPLYDEDEEFAGALGILSNITRQKEASEALKLKDMLNSIAKSAGIAMTILNPDYTIEWYNDLNVKWFGALEKTKGRNCFEVFEGRDSVCGGCPSRVSFEQGKIAIYECSGIKTSVGADRTFNLTAAPIRDTQDKVIQVVEIAQDITERKQSEESLRKSNEKVIESEQQFREIFDNLNDCIFVIDVFPNDKFKIKSVNSSEAKALNMNRSDVEGKFVDELFPVETSTSVLQNYQLVKNTKQIYKYEEEFEFLEKTIYSTILVPLINDLGETYRIIGVSRDITLNKKAEEALKESEEKFYKLFHSSPVAMTLTSLKDGRYLDVNSEFLRITERSEEEVVGHKASELNIWLYPEQRDFIISKIRESGVLRNFEQEGLTKSGKVFHFLGSAELVVIRNETYILISSQDITDRKDMEEMQQRIQKLESIGKLAGGIAHEFNNLFAGIFGFIELGKVKSNDDKVKHYLSRAMSNIGRAKSLTQQLLTFAEGGAPVMKTQSLIPFIEETAQSVLTGSDVLCQFNISKNISLCSFDEIQINQALSNMILNAKESMPAGGTIEVSVGNIKIKKEDKENALQSEKDYVKISIKDSGVGISKEILPKIFDPFFSTKKMGSGLGLSICHSIIKRHDGWIEVESEPDKSSTFHIYLPAYIESNETTKNNQKVNIESNGSFLIMDDEEMILDMMNSMLSEMGYSVKCVNNGKEAIKALFGDESENISFSAIILDLVIPGGIGGKEVVSEIRKNNKEIPVFVISGYSDDPVMKDPTKYGFNASLSKPFTRTELAELLNQYVKK